MARKDREELKQHVTKRRLARWERERRRRRIYTSIGVSVIAVVVAIVAYGYYTANISMAGEWVTTVGGVSFYGDDYADALRLCNIGFCPEPASGDEREAPILFMEINEISQKGAVADGISVTDEEVTQSIKLMLETARNESLTDAEFQEAYPQLLADLGLSATTFRGVVETSLVQEKLTEYLQAQVPDSAEQVYLETILLSNEEEVEAVLQELQAGEDFVSVGQNYSYSDTGWLPRGIMSPTMDEIAFSLNISGVSAPIIVDDVYYIIRVVDKEVRDLDEATKQQIEANAFSVWIGDEMQTKVERNPDLNLAKLYDWAAKEIGGVTVLPTEQPGGLPTIQFEFE